MNKSGCNTINSILSIRTYINTSIILLPTILLSLLSSTLFRIFQSLRIMIPSCEHPVFTLRTVITFASQIACSAISFPVVLRISTKNITGLCPSFNLRAFERQQLYEVWAYIGSIILCPVLHYPIYTSSNLAHSRVHLNINVIMYGYFGPPFLFMKSINSFQCLTSVYKAWSCLGARIISSQFNTKRITIMNVVFRKSGRLILTILLIHSPKSVAGNLLPQLSFYFASQTFLAHIFKNISTNSRQIHSAISKLSNGSQFSNVCKWSSPTISQCRDPSWSCCKWFCPRIMDWCFFSRHPTIHTSFHLLNPL